MCCDGSHLVFLINTKNRIGRGPFNPHLHSNGSMVSEKNIAILKKKIPSGPMLKLYPTEGAILDLRSTPNIFFNLCSIKLVVSAKYYLFIFTKGPMLWLCPVIAYILQLDFPSTQKNKNSVKDHPMTFHVQFGLNLVSSLGS
jgi:hypothetical protein